MVVNDVLPRIKHLVVAGLSEFHAYHASFPSTPNVEGVEYLTVVFTNSTGIHMVTCTEGETLSLNEERTELSRENSSLADSDSIEHQGEEIAYRLIDSNSSIERE